MNKNLDDKEISKFFDMDTDKKFQQINSLSNNNNNLNNNEKNDLDEDSEKIIDESYIAEKYPDVKIAKEFAEILKNFSPKIE